MHACRCACNSSLGFNSPGALAFSRDMFMDTPLIADILAIQKNRQLLVDKRLLRENAKRIKHDYAVDDLVLKKDYLGFSDKLKPPPGVLTLLQEFTPMVQLPSNCLKT